MTRSLPAASILVLFLCAPASAFESGPERVTLLEIYSSEGCSSCPPADAWASGLADEQGLWKDFVPVVFHVDYWDHLGWKDRFASAEFTRRQREYASAGSADSVYTPGFVVNGREWRVWASGDAPPRSAGERPGTLRVLPAGEGRWEVRFEPLEAAPAAGWTAHAARLAFDVSSQVTAGENEGEILRHDFLAVGYARSPMEADADGFLAVLDLGPEASPGRRALAAWVTRDGSPEPVQAAGGPTGE